MADETPKMDWSILLQDDEPISETPAVPELPEQPQQEQTWGSIANQDWSEVDPVDPAIPAEPAPFSSEYEGWKAIKEGTKALPKYFSQIPKSIQETRKELFDKIGAVDPVEAMPEGVQDFMGAIDIARNPLAGLGKLLSYGDEQGFFDADQDYAKRKENKDTYTKYFEDLTQMGPQTILNYVAGGIGGWAGVAATAGGQIYGGSYMNFREKGNTPMESMALALTDTAIQLPIEVLLTTAIIKGPKGAMNLGKKLPGGNKIFTNIEKGLKTKFKNGEKFAQFADSYAGRILGGGMAEGAEEFVQSLSGILTELAGQWLRDEEITAEGIRKLIKEKTSEGLWSALVAFPLGGLGGGVGKVLEPVKDKKDPNDNIIPDAGKPAINPDPATEKIDAANILEEAGKRWLEEEEAAAGAPPVDETQIEIGPDTVIGGPQEIGPDTVIGGPAQDFSVIAEEPETTERFRVETTPDHPAAEFYGLKKGDKKHAISITDKESPAYKATFVAEMGKEDVAIAKKEMEFQAGKRDEEGFINTWMANPEARPWWASKQKPVELKSYSTDLEQIYNDSIKYEASTAYGMQRGDLSMREESYAVNSFRELIEEDTGASDIYGDDFISQMKDEELRPAQRAWKNIIEKFFDRPVFYVKESEASKNDMASPVKQYRAAANPVQGAVILFDNQTAANVGSMFHELTHNMRKTAPQLYGKLHKFIQENVDKQSDAFKRLERAVRKAYGGRDREGLIQEEINTAIITDLVKGDVFQGELFRKLKAQDPGTFERLAKHIKNALKKLVEYITRHRNKPGYAALLNDVKKAEKEIANIFAEFQAETQKGPWVRGMSVAAIKRNSETLMLELKKDQTINNKFTSKMVDTISKKLQGTGDAGQMRATIESWIMKGEIKEEEYRWSGLDEFLMSWELANGKKKITKDRILQHIAENAVQIEEDIRSTTGEDVEKIDIPQAEEDIAKIEYYLKDSYGITLRKEFRGNNQPYFNEIMFKDYDEDTKPYYLTDPGIKAVILEKAGEEALEFVNNAVKTQTEVSDYRAFLYTRGEGGVLYQGYVAEGPYKSYSEVLLSVPNIDDMDGGHWRKNKKVIAHARVTERTHPDGDEIFHVDEIQSDLHQRGRVHGYRSEKEKIKELPEGSRVEQIPVVGKRAGRWRVELPAGTKTQYGGYIFNGDTRDEAIQSALDEMNQFQNKQAPDAPFKKGWELLVLKRMVRMAADQNKAAITWDIGQNQADRYDLRKFVKEVGYSISTENLWAYDDNDTEVISEDVEVDELDKIKEYLGEEVGQRLIDKIESRKWERGEYTTTFDEDEGKWVLVDPNGELFHDQGGDLLTFDEEYEARETLEEFLDRSDEREGGVRIRGLELETGGEGMIGFYDKKLPAIANKFFGKKKWGNSKVFKTKLDGTSENEIVKPDVYVDGVLVTDRNLNRFIRNFEDEDIDFMIKEAIEWREKTTTYSAHELRDDIVKYLEGLKEKGSTIEWKNPETQFEVWALPITKQMKKASQEGLMPLFQKKLDVDTNKTAGPELAASAIENAVLGVGEVKIDSGDFASGDMLRSIGFESTRAGNYKFDRRIPKDVDIIKGLYKASWNTDLESNRAAKIVLDKISQQLNKQKRTELGREEQKRGKETLKEYLNDSWETHSIASKETSKGDLRATKNILLRPNGVKSGKGRQLMVQVSNNFAREEATQMGDSYFDTLYSKREGYDRPSDFWEVPEWMGRLAKSMPKADVYVVRNIAEAKKFIEQAGYGDNIFFSAMDANKDVIKTIISDYSGKVKIGGYTDPNYFGKKATFLGSPEEAAQSVGVEFKPGVDYRHFKGTKTIPRLEMSRGCRHKCAFCTVEKSIVAATDEQIDDQLENFKSLDYKLVYLNDKTFGQAKNFEKLIDIKKKIEAVNPNFQGFIIQTTAPQFLKMSDSFLRESGIKFVELGAETINDDILAKINKPHRVAHIEKAAEKIRRLKMNFVPNIMVGLAGVDKGKLWTETIKTYGNTLKFLKKHKDIVSHVNVYVLATYEGTALHEQLGTNEVDSDENVIEKSWLKNQKLHEKFYGDVLEYGTQQLNEQRDLGELTNEEIEKMSFEERAKLILGPDASFDDIDKLAGQAKDVVDSLTPDLQKDIEDDIKKGAKAEGEPGTESYQKGQYQIFEIASKAKGLKKVRKYLETVDEMNGLPVTPELIENLGRLADKLSSDRKRANKFKKVIQYRDELATGKATLNDPEFVKKCEKVGGIQPYTVRHTADNFFIGRNMRYGKFEEAGKLSIFDTGDQGKTTKKSYIDPVTGRTKYIEKRYDSEGNRLIEAPIFSTDRATRLKQIKKIVLKNKQYQSWYQNWKDFMWQFIKNDVDETKLKRIITISGMLGAGKSPQSQQAIWAETINQLEHGMRPRKVAGQELPKIMDIWNGKYDELLGKTDDESIAEIQATFGRKIGPYLAAAMDPNSPNVLVLDRHMPKGWGYNVLATKDNPQGGWNMHPAVEAEISRDIFEVAKDLKISVAGVQAALWFDFRTPAADVSDIVELSQVQPGKNVPFVFHKQTFPDPGVGIHYKKTPMKPGDYVVGASADGKVKYNSYSMTDIGERIARGTKDWPYQPVVYMYTPGARPETSVRGGGRKGYTFKFSNQRIYDGVNDPYKYWDTARREHKESPEASLTNIFLTLVKRTDQYDGALVTPAHGDKPWMMIFDQAAVDDFPELTNVGISDIVESIEGKRDVVRATKSMASRAKQFEKYLKWVKDHGRKYSEVTIERSYYSLARFEGATSGQHEPGIGLKLDGPLRSQRAYLAEVAISRGQREAYLIHEPRTEMDYPDYIDWSEAKMFIFKAINEYNENPEKLAKDLSAAGLKEFNIVMSPSSGILTIEQVVFSDENAKQMADIMEKFADKGHPHNQVKTIHTEVITDESGMEMIKEYWGNKKGEEIIENAKERGEKYQEGLRRRVDKQRASQRKDTGDKKPKGSDDSGLGTDLQVRVDDKKTQEVLDRVGRNPVKTIDTIKEKLDYKPGKFTTSYIDKLHPLKMYAGAKSSSYMQHRSIPGVQSSINAMMEHGTLKMDKSGVLTTDTKGKGFIPFLKSLKGDSDKFFYWLIAQRDQAREKRDSKYKPMFTQEERNRIFSWTGKRSKTGKSWGEVNAEFRKFNDSVLQVGIDSGLLDPAMVAQFRDQFYIPFYRIFEDENTTAEFIKAPVNTKKIIAAQIKKLKGSKKKIGDPLENILANWSHLIKQSMANSARRSSFRELQDVLTENLEPAVEAVPWSETVIFKSGDDGKTTFVYPKDNVEVLGFKDKGKTQFFKVNDPELFQALSLQNNMRLPAWLSAILGAPKALLTFGATITPSFIAANATRDTLHTYTISKGFKPFWDTMKGFYKTLVKDQDYVEYMASGNSFVGSYVKAETPEKFSKYAKKIAKKEGQGALRRILSSPSKLWRFWEGFTEASENATRLALYSKRRAEGYSILESSFEARDIMDFQKKGASPVIQYLIATIPFLNARIQGLARMGSAMAENPKMYALKGASVAMASIALWAAFADDDRYKELEDWERFSYYHFWIGDKHFRIPKPFETGVIWSSAWTAAADVIKGNNEAKHITRFIGAALLDTFAFNPVPQAARPILEQYMNKVFFTGRPIESMGMQYKEPANRYYPWDSESAIVLGKALGVSPKRIQALIRGYLAGLGMGIMGAADIMVRQFGEWPERPESGIESYPMIGRFVRSTPNRYSRYQSEFYDIYDELNLLHKKVRDADAEGDFAGAEEIRKANQKKFEAFPQAKIIRRNLARIRKNTLAIWKDKTMSAENKREELDRLTTKRNTQVKEFYDWYKKAINS